METTKNHTTLAELKRSAVLVRICAGQSVSAICRELDLDRGHVYQWLRSPDGRARLETALADAYAEIEARLPGLVRKSLEVLERDLDSKFSPERGAKAAQTVLALLARLSPRPQGEPNLIEIDESTWR